MDRTNKYQLGYFEKGDVTSSDVELQRFETIDAQLNALFSVIGNGVLTGWNIIPASGLSVTVTPGKGHVAFLAIESGEDFVLDGLTPGSTETPAINYIYAQTVFDSYWTKSGTFGVYVTPMDNDDMLFIGTVSTDESKVVSIDISSRAELGFVNLIKNIVSEHRHIGGVNNPDPINLATDVQGVLSQNSLPDLDASIITTGELSTEVLPTLNHITHLQDQGTISHAQIESLLSALSIPGQMSLGDVSLTNLLQLVLSLKHVYPNIDDYLVNCISIIPGISPDEYIDTTNTTATVDTRTYLNGGQHTITGAVSVGRQLYTKIWDDKADYTDGTFYNTVVDGNTIALNTTNDKQVIDDFAEIDGWQISTNDSSSLSANVSLDTIDKVSEPQSAKISINGNEIEMVLLSQKEFPTSDWSSHKYISFYILTDSVQHGDIFFYFRDGLNGVQNSYIKILDRNKPTINEDTRLNGWQEITIDISTYDRSAVNMLGFMLSTQDGWEPSKSFSFNIDDICLSTGNFFEENGYCRFVFGNDFPYNFYALRWDANLPSGTQIKGRARFANSVLDLANAQWTEYTYTSNDTLGLEENEFYKYVEIELFLDASEDKSLSPQIKSVYVDYYASDTTNNYSIDTKEEWKNGQRFNIDTTSSPNSIRVGQVDADHKVAYGGDGGIGFLNDNFEKTGSIIGTALPISTKQALSGEQSGFGLITAIDRGDNGSVWVADTDNDRVLEIDACGNMIRGFYGSFLSEPANVYGIEDAGAGSNIYESNIYVTEFDGTTPATATKYDLEILHSIYNPNTGVLYVVFNKNIENIYNDSSFDVNKMYMKVGTQVFRFSDSKIEMMGISDEKYDLWSALYKSKAQRETEAGIHIRQFKFSSHVLQITIPQSEQIALNKMVRTNSPRVAIDTPYANEVKTNTFTAKFVYYNAAVEPGGDFAQVIIDGGSPTNIYSNSIDISGLANGEHTIKVALYNSDSVAYSNIGAECESSFIVDSNTQFAYPVIGIISPKPNQVFSSSSVCISFVTRNFPIIPSGQHISYQIDGGAIYQMSSSNSICIEFDNPGEHTIEAFLVDENNQIIGYDNGTVEVSFVVGSNPDALVKLFYLNSLVKDISKTSTNLAGYKFVDVANIIFANIYSPIDVQVVPYETSAEGTSLSSILIGKLRSQSWSEYLSEKSKSVEFAARILNAIPPIQEGVENPKLPVNLEYANIASEDLVFGNKFMDGHSVVQLDLSGKILMSNNAAVFASSRTEAKNILGGVKKVGQNELLIADSKNQRAIITYTDMDTQDSKITWQYDSDRYVVDFVKFPEEDMVISVGNGSIDQPDEVIVRGYTITWKNDSAAPIEIYSGNTDYESFYDNPNLSQYGVLFQSGTLNPGETYSYRFETNGEFDWFVYPSILTGKVTVTEQRISSNDMFYILESDGLDSPYTSRAIKVDSWGNVLWSFGNNYLVKPRDIRTLTNNRVLIST